MKLNFTFKKWHSLILLLFIFGFSNQVSAADYYIKSGLTGTAGAPLAWNTASNWAIGGAGGTAATEVPTSSDNVFILAGKYVTIPLGVTGSCAILNVVGTTANLYLEGTALLNCTTININTGGNITMKAANPSSNIITCSGTINCGNPALTTSLGKGTLTVSNGSAVSCGKLAMGAGLSTSSSTIPGRTGSSTFTFTGSGSDVIPVITTGVSSTTPVFASVIFAPGAGNTITIPSGFCSLAMSIASGTVDFGNNYSTVFTATSGSLNMDALTTLKIGGDKQIPNMATYLFNDTSTVNFTGSTQIIRGILSGYKNLTLSGAGLKTLGGEVTIKLTLSIADGTILDLAGFNLTLSGNYVNGAIVEGVYTKGTGCIRSSSASNIWYRGYSNSAMQFDQTTPGTTNVVKNITLGDLPANLGATTPSEINPLDLTIESPLNITGTVNFIAGHLVSNGNVTFKSDINTTAFVGPITDLTYCGVIGDVTVERFIPAGSNVDGTNLGRAYRALSSPVTGGTVFSNWQEGGSTDAAFGTHITGKKGTVGQFDATTGLDYTASGNPSMFTYYDGWNPVINTINENLIVGKPYLFTIRGDRTIDLASNASVPTDTTLRSTGGLFEGPLEVVTLNPTLNSFNFVGNPYQAPVDLSIIFNSNRTAATEDPVAPAVDGDRWAGLGTSYTVFDTKMNAKGAYVTYDFDLAANNDLSATSVMNHTLEPNQAFFVQTSEANPILVFNEEDKDVASNGNAYVPMYRKAKTNNSLIKGSVINAGTNKALDGFILAFSDTYNNDIVAEDSKKISNADENFSIKNGSSNLVIDKRKNPSENDVIALNLTQQRLSDYILKFEVSNFDAKDAYLVDAYTKKETALKNNQINSYAFKVDATPESAAADRFSIVFKAATSLSTVSNSLTKFSVYPNPVVDNKFTVRTNQDLSGKKASLNIVNTLGQKVYSTNATFSNDGSIAVNPANALSKGIYFLKVAVDGKVETKKLIIK